DGARFAREALRDATELDGVARARVRGVVLFDNELLAWLSSLHGELRRRGGEDVVIELPPRDADVDALAGRLERYWGEDNDHPTLELALAKARATPIEVVEAAHETSEARAAVRAVLDALAAGAALDKIALVPCS